MIWQIAMMFLSHKWGLTSFNRFRVYYRIDTRRFGLYTGHTTCISTCAARGADHAYPSGTLDDIPGFCEVHTASVLCLWRSCSIPFICPCYFYCLFLYNLCIAIFLELWCSGLFPLLLVSGLFIHDCLFGFRYPLLCVLCTHCCWCLFCSFLIAPFDFLFSLFCALCK
jgi:hypothetical protein